MCWLWFVSRGCIVSSVASILNTITISRSDIRSVIIIILTIIIIGAYVIIVTITINTIIIVLIILHLILIHYFPYHSLIYHYFLYFLSVATSSTCHSYFR